MHTGTPGLGLAQGWPGWHTLHRMLCIKKNKVQQPEEREKNTRSTIKFTAVLVYEGLDNTLT